MDNIPNTFLTRASDILGDTTSGLSGSNIVKAFSGYAYDFDVEIPHSIYPFDAQNKRSALLDNLKVFEPELQYKIIRELCEHPKLPQPVAEDINNLKIQLIARYSSVFGNVVDTTLNQPLVEEVKSFLSDFPTSETVYLTALTKFNNNVFERNLLDDLRLSLELLLKEVFGNEKSLENQVPSIGQFISSKGGSKHFSNMFRTLVDYYTKYQNAFVKHNDAVVEEEVEFIFEMTSSFMKHLIKMHHKG
ncbi:hypothetical protein VroAM7_16700 [Vibrio rotiferianus]|uniref:Uncharacterized protein n=1 Tax=Vibrio rotiferianus TaxID=190895 RepID=A0A510I627_9VIBR|nr:hypothetical protein [Vibrio rotiferianus]BBL89017.1 hypothetical protein VroAM7_16700 [Vibrio rotiferianus]